MLDACLMHFLKKGMQRSIRGLRINPEQYSGVIVVLDTVEFPNTNMSDLEPNILKMIYLYTFNAFLRCLQADL